MMNKKEEMDKPMNHERISFLDYLRAFAPFMVMLVHASENFYGADTSGLAAPMSYIASEENRFWVAFYDGALARTCVPLFMMMSAYLLIPMNTGVSMLGFYKRRLLRVVPPMLVFLLLYSILPLIWNGMTWEQSRADLQLLPFNFTSMCGHLWFMYPLISLYLIIPVISPWLERSSAKDERVFIGLFLLSTTMPWLRRFVTGELWGECFWNNFHALWYCSGFIGYAVMAHYVRFHLKWQRSKKLRIGGLCFLASALFTGWGFWTKGIPGQLIDTPLLEWAWEFCTPNVVLATFGAFILFSCIEVSKTPRIIKELSNLSFGMYLMHMFFLAPIATWFINGDVTHPRISVALTIPAIAVISYVCCAVTTKLLSLLSGSKYVVGTSSR